jgi:hypothetical protein
MEKTHISSLGNPYASTKTHFQSHFLFNIWCGIIGNQLIRLLVLEEHLKSEHYHFLGDLLPMLLDVALNIR